MSIQKPVYGGEFPFPPSVNTYTACVRNRKILSKRGREYKKAVAGICEEAGISGLRLKGSISFHIELRPPDNRRRDLDNHLKALIDGFTSAGVWEDDSQITHMTCIKGEKVKGGKAIVSIVEISG